MIVVYAGRLPSAPGGDFPAANVPSVRARLQTMIAALRPRLLVGSAAAGADLLVLSVALELGGDAGPECRVVTAGTRQTFENRSVAGRGSGWVPLYRGILADTRRVDLVELMDLPRDETKYAQVNDFILRSAREAREPGDEPVVGIRVGPATSRRRTAVDHTAHLSDGLSRLNFPVYDVRTDLAAAADAQR